TEHGDRGPVVQDHLNGNGLAMADLTLLTDDELRERRIALSRSLTTAADLIPTPPPSFFEKLKQDIDAAAAEWIARRS
ncbi:MAG: hypothetical protein OJJ55_25370, partial [Rhodococcus sp.]|nr:hypothetical protein [Rhodococcus sp. (in: high G+C Gram-positive bacteria)]